MIPKKFLNFILLFLIHNIYVFSSEQHLVSLPTDALQSIACYFNFHTIERCKEVCKTFNNNIHYWMIDPILIEAENDSLCTKGLIYFAKTQQVENFRKLILNNLAQRMGDIQILGWGEKPSLEDQMQAYKGIQGPQKIALKYDTLNVDIRLRLISLNPNMLNNKDRTLLHWAASYGEYKVTAELLNNKKTNLNMQDKNGNTALHIACRNNNDRIISLLLNNQKIDPNIQNKDGDTALHIACFRNNEAMVSLLLNNQNVDPNIPTKDSYCTALHIACQNHNDTIISLLLNNKKINLNIKDKDNNTALHIACFNYKETIAALLLNSKKINPNIQTKNNFTALDLACQRDLTKTIQLLQAKNAKHSWRYYGLYWKYWEIRTRHWKRDLSVWLITMITLMVLIHHYNNSQ